VRYRENKKNKAQPKVKMNTDPRSSQSLAIAITKAASKQTYYTIRILADRSRAADAYRAYAYFRWVDDIVDAKVGLKEDKIAFIDRQNALLESFYRREDRDDLCIEEQMLYDMVCNDTGEHSGLRSYLCNMMDVMVFDARRRGNLVSQADLSEYSKKLASAVTEAMYYFIGHDDPAPFHEARYLAVTAAHITHMLRDTVEDIENGYFNIPQEVLTTFGISPRDIESQAYREWTSERVQLARSYFKAGRLCTASVRNLRCRLAGCAYTARFEWMLRAIERDNYRLRIDYPERKSLWAGLWMGWATLTAMLALGLGKSSSHDLVSRSLRIEHR
jgi:phytoene/squalene synthetase